MANRKISELSSRTPSLTDLMLVGDPSSGYSYKCTITALATIIETDIADGYVTLATTQTISGAKTFSNVLTLTSVANSAVDTDKFLVLTASNTVNYRTGAEVLSDIGGASASSISGTTNYVAKFTSSSAIGNSLIFDNGTNVGISTTSPSYKLDVSGSLRSTTSSYFATGGGNIGIGTTGVTGIGGPILQIHASTYPEIHLTNSTTGDQFQDGTSIHVSGSSLNILNYESGSINLSTSGTQRVSIASDGNVTLSVIANATTDTDRFLVSDSGVIKYRTGAELLSDIGGQGSISLSAIGSTPNANGATLTSNTLTLQPASASFGGVVTTGFQEFEGQKRFVGNPIQFDKHLEIKNNNSWGVSWGYTSFASKDTPVFGFLRGHSFSPTPTSYNAWFTYGSTGDRNYTLPSSDGTLALTSDITSSISGTTNYIPKFTSSSAIGNSIFTENGGNGLRIIAADANIRLDGSNDYLLQTVDADGRFRIYDQTAAVERITLTSSGNLGLGVTPSAWSSGGRIEIGNDKTIVAQGPSILLGANLYFNSGFKYVTTGASTFYYQTGGQHQWFNAPSGTAGNAISFTQAMTLDASGNLMVGGTTASAKLTVTGVTNGQSIRTEHSSAYSFLYSTIGGANPIAFDNSSGGLIVYTGSAARLAVTSGGNVGIGTTSPSEKLDLQGTMNMNGASGTYLQVQYNGGNRGYLGTANSVIAGGSTGDFGISATSNLVFGTGGSLTERMRITSGGEVVVGATSAFASGLVCSDGGNSYVPFAANVGTTSNAAQMYFNNPNGAVGSITTSGSTTSYNIVSDYRLKQDFKSFNGLALIDSMNVYDYQWKIDSSRAYGVKAHELQAVIPYAVTGVKDGKDMQGVDYSKLVPVLVQAIKDLKAEIETLKNK